MWSVFPRSSADTLWIPIKAAALDRGAADLPGSALQKARLAVLQSSKGLLWRGQRSKGRSSWHVANRKHKRREKFVFLFWSDVRADSKLQPSPLHPLKCCSLGHLMHMFNVFFFFSPVTSHSFLHNMKIDWQTWKWSHADSSELLCSALQLFSGWG